MDFVKSKVDENYSLGSEYISKHIDTNFSDLRNLLSSKIPGLDFENKVNLDRVILGQHVSP